MRRSSPSESHQNLGAQLAIYRPDPDNRTFELIATTPYIGRRNRWLAPVGVADFNGDGQMDIAYVDRPHLARTLRVWSFVPGGLAGTGELREIASAGGFSNHRIGEDFITGGVRDCGAGPEMVLADAGWTSVMVARMVDGVIEAESVARFSPEADRGRSGLPVGRLEYLGNKDGAELVLTLTRLRGVPGRPV